MWNSRLSSSYYEYLMNTIAPLPDQLWMRKEKPPFNNGAEAKIGRRKDAVP